LSWTVCAIDRLPSSVQTWRSAATSAINLNPIHCAVQHAAKRTTAVTALVFIVSARSNKDTLITTQRACQSQRALDAVLDSFPWTPCSDDAFYLFLQRRLLPRASSSAAHARSHPQCRPPAAIAPFGISALHRVSLTKYLFCVPTGRFQFYLRASLGQRVYSRVSYRRSVECAVIL
jgi:hypothetical protein